MCGRSVLVGASDRRAISSVTAMHKEFSNLTTSRYNLVHAS
jgi:hypothetical protein